jgi:alkyl sulfatase BDS1-like metallo-beta-lactamase superfamily hydrolase
MKQLRHAWTLSAAWIAVALTIQPGFSQSRDAEPATRAVNDAFVNSLPFADRADFDDARRGFIATLPDGMVAGVGSKPAFDTRPYAFLQKDEVPATVNPMVSSRSPTASIRCAGKHIVINWTFTDRNQTYVMNLENSALTHRAGKLDDNADAGVKLTRAALDAITLKQRTFLGSIDTGDVSISGNPLKLRELFGLLDDFTPDFEIVEPRKVSVE